jgi:hypothetical protein
MAYALYLPVKEALCSYAENGKDIQAKAKKGVKSGVNTPQRQPFTTCL